GGIGGFVFRALAAIRETVGNQPLVEVLQKAADYLPPLVEQAASQQQSWEREHGVPAPVSEPRVARDDGWLSIRAGDDELIRRSRQAPDGCVRGRRPPSRPLGPFQPFHGYAIKAPIGLKGSGNPGRLLGRQLEVNRAHPIEIFPEVEAAIELF